MWCNALNAAWEWASSYCLFHPAITNQVGPAPNSPSLCSQHEALLKPPTKQNNCLSHWPSRIGVNLVTRLNPYGVSCNYSWEWAHQGWWDSQHEWGLTTGACAADPGGMCPSGTLTAASLFFRMLGRDIGANWKPGQGGVLSYQSSSLDPVLNQKYGRVKR